jgi:hypothetical protein
MPVSHRALISLLVYYYLISNYDNPVALTNLVWSLVVSSPLVTEQNAGLTAMYIG